MAKRASVTFANLDEVIINIRTAFREVQTSKALLRDLAFMHRKRIALEARRGRRMRGLGREDDNLPDLKPFTIRARQILGAFNPTHRAFRPRRGSSNVTITGQLIDGLTVKTFAKRGQYMLRFSGQRDKYYVPTEAEFRHAFASQLKKDPRWYGVWRILDDSQNKQLTTNVGVYKSLLRLNPRYQILSVNDKLMKGLKRKIQRVLRRELRSRGF